MDDYDAAYTPAAEGGFVVETAAKNDMLRRELRDIIDQLI